MNRFKELRISRGLTQEEFRKQFNHKFNKTYTAAAISQFENGKRTPEISSLIDFADFYGVSLDYLLGRDEVSTSGFSLSDEQATVLSSFEELNEEYREDFFSYLDYLRQKQLKKLVNVKSSISQTFSRHPQRNKITLPV